MNKNTMETLEFNKIKESIKQYAVSEKTKDMIDKLNPALDIAVLGNWMEETTQARNIIDKKTNIPLTSLEGLENIIKHVEKEGLLNIKDFNSIKALLEAVNKMKKFMEGMNTIAPKISLYAQSMYELKELLNEIERCVVNDIIDDNASSDLSKIRKKMLIADERIKQKINNIITSPKYADLIQDTVVSMRQGKYVIPIKRKQKKLISGSVLDISGSGSTVFVTPAVIEKLQSELDYLRIEEEKEIYKILSYLTLMVIEKKHEISINIEAMLTYDYIFAKAKYSKSINGIPVNITTGGVIRLNKARHPMLGKSAIPLDFHIGKDYSALLITGPNTGGKTVALKTIGLMVIMAQCGLHLPVEKGSQISIFTDVLTDIGDGQSIEQSLSTFSSHVRNITSIVECAGKNTLVILDELGAGTDPSEGMGFAIAILEEIMKKKATIIATTHFSEIKEFAEKTPGFKNGCMEFDINSLKPLYKLSIGKAGQSNAFIIALRLGMDRKIIERAHQITYKEKKEYNIDKKNSNQPVINKEVIQSHKKLEDKVERISNIKKVNEKVKRESIKSVKLGDCVYIPSMDTRGIVCEEENAKGNVGVMIKGKKIVINKKRLTVYIDGKDLYPEDYDFDVILETKENRKKRKLMRKRHVEGITIEKEKNY